MLDFRYQTFLTLCDLMNYTKTAEILHMTQPAVTQHIHYLESAYDCKLFIYSGKLLSLTEKGKKLLNYVKRMNADAIQIKEAISSTTDERVINFGATLTIGEFVMPEIISSLIVQHDIKMNMLVENTKSLLNRLENGEISFALMEGFFDKSLYGHQLFSNEDFIGICSNKSYIKNKKLKLSDLLSSRLIVRENGSGTRDILEQVLFEKNLTTKSFHSVIEVGNMNVIKELVAEDIGISFMYKAAADTQLKDEKLSKIEVSDFEIKREFNFVYLKNSVHEDEYLKWFDLFGSC